MEIRGELTEKDYLRAQWLHMKPRRGFRAAGYVVLVLFLLALGLAVASAVAGSAHQPLAHVLLPVLVLGGVVVLQRYQWKRIYRRQLSLQGLHTYTFSAEGIVASSAHGNGRMDWTVFIKWREDPNLFLLYQADNLFHMIPKRWLTDDRQLAEFRALVSRHAGPCVG